MHFEDWVKKIHNNVNIPDKEWGKSLTYLAFDEMDKLIGLLSVRYDLPREKVMKFGHIGYGVRPSERRKGYATIMLNLALEKCDELGLENVLVTCKEENIGSAKTIENNCGVLREVIFDSQENCNFKKYWINIKEALNKKDEIRRR